MLRNQIGQQMIIGLQGLSLSNEEANFIAKNNIGGVILFKRNIESPKQVRELSAQLQDLRKTASDKAPLFISVDMEGGRVHRMKPPFTQWPALSFIGKLDSTSVAFRFAQAMGEELRSVGVNLDFAPCIDIFSNPANSVIGDRSLGGNPETVAKLGSALVRGYIKADIIPCAKHFPGHGNTLLDSHEALPIEDKSLEELEAFEMEPFKKIFRARLEMIMAAHIKYPKVDNEWPASLSETFLKTVLRERLRYRGLIITDDLDMKALTSSYDKPTIATRAIQAGANILLYCNESDSPAIALEAIEKAVQDKTLDAKVITENQSKVLTLKRAKLVQPEPHRIEDVSRIVGHPDHIRLAKAIVDGSVPADLVAQAT
jgi:beta-N-acetylhexosaminidase